MTPTPRNPLLKDIKGNFLKFTYPTLMAYRGCGLDFLVTKCVFWGAGLYSLHCLIPPKIWVYNLMMFSMAVIMLSSLVIGECLCFT